MGDRGEKWSYYPQIHRVFEKNVKLQNLSTTCRKRSLFQEIIYSKMNNLHFRHQLRLVNLMIHFFTHVDVIFSIKNGVCGRLG